MNNSSPPQQLLRHLPAVDQLLNTTMIMPLLAEYGRLLVVDALRNALNQTRQQLIAGKTPPDLSPAAFIKQAKQILQAQFRPTLRPVINATGVIIHTNLGRAPLSEAAQQAVQAAASQYNTLEFNLNTGKRGSRYLHAEAALCDITGAEAALVVNNNAAALVLILSALAQQREVILSRGQLVEIGGGFRIPDIMVQSGARLVEVGTTNRTRATDYQRAISADTALLMRIHSSNFKQVGFVEETALADLATIAHEHGVHLVDDLGSGALLDTAQYGLAHEPTVHESVAAGADVIAFSGDKLLGGPQAGIIIGKRDLIQRLKQHPLARALRVDKLIYAALAATLDHYRKGQAIEKIPIWQMMARPIDDIQQTAAGWQASVGGEVVPGESAVGGGSLPGTTLATYLLVLQVSSAESAAAWLRSVESPVIARIQDERLLFDPRTVLPAQEAPLLETLRQMRSKFNM